MMINILRMISGWAVLVLLPLCLITSDGKRDTIIVEGTDCTHIRTILPNAPSGIYNIQPQGVKKPFKVHCEMLPDGGWTVIQRRTGRQLSFNRNWNEYKHGFGSFLKDHWLGLAKIWALTKHKKGRSTLKVDLWDFEGKSVFAKYEDFRIGSEKTAYKLHVGTYSGNAGDAFRGLYTGIDQNGYGFSTYDRDNDGCSPCIFGDIAMDKCSDEKGGGWWFSRCGSASLHGDWHPMGNNRGYGSGLHWLTWRSPEPYSAKATRMMIKTKKQT
ncbi:fibrinogen-like protein 1 [Trichomycterus rosablanca]|uniref:fibrinogen-like protein 1 n=1 Tax=Trichomycterus rosablanca TaxID=2290929 RepID=UPI002F3558FE